MSAAALLQAEPGEKVLDLCAAPGGKSTQIASSMKGEGLLVVIEIHPARAKILSQNVERMGIRNSLVCNVSPESLADHFPAFFDRILCDVLHIHNTHLCFCMVLQNMYIPKYFHSVYIP